MTIDERLERRTERHETLAQSLQLLSIDIAPVNKTVDVLAQSNRDFLTLVRSHETRITQLEASA